MARQFERPTSQYLSDPVRLARWADKFLTSLEGALTDITDQVADIAAAQAAADAAAADAATAQSTATTANNTATTVKRDDAISASWTSPGSILSAADVGSDCTISIASHTRKYGDGTSVSVNSGSITGRSFSTTYYVYYNDSNRSGGSVSYQSTTNPNTALPNAGTGRHFCGSVTTPADGGGGTSGGTVPPGGDFSGPGEIP